MLKKITTPTDMAADFSQLQKAVEDFERQFKSESKGETYYHLVIEYELNKETCKTISEMYKKAGWKDARCKTSSENGERAGLTGLQLYM